MVDANVLIAALLRDSTTRRLILLGGLELHAPRYLLEEVEAHWEELHTRTGLPEGVVREVLHVLRGYVSEHEPENYLPYVDKAEGMLREGDPQDVPYVALALAIGADGLWSEDRRLASLPGLRVLRTADVLDRLGGSES